MSSASRTRVLAAFKKLHRTGHFVFQGDAHALSLTRAKINGGFKENKAKEDTEEIEKLVSIAESAERTLREGVVQAKYNPKTEAYKMRITRDTMMIPNTLFDPNAQLPKSRRKQKCDDNVDKT